MSTDLVFLAIIVIGYPLLSVVLAEWHRSLKARQSEYAGALGQIQLFVLPFAAIFLLLTQIAGGGLPTSSAAETSALSDGWVAFFARIVLTLSAIFLMNALLSGVNSFLKSNRSGIGFFANMPGLVLDLVRFGIVMVGAAAIISYIWNVNLQGALVGLGVGGIVLGLALQDTLSALFAGLSMVSQRIFREGDFIETPEHSGQILAMDWRSITVLTEQKFLSVIPNSMLATSAFSILSTETMPYGEEVHISFSYSDPPEKVIELIDAVARSVPDIMTTPQHEIEVLDFTDTGIKYELMFFVPQRGMAWRVRSDFLRRFWYAVERAGLSPNGAHNRLYRPVQGVEASARSLHECLAGVFPKDCVGFDVLVDTVKLERYGRNEILMDLAEPFNQLFVTIDGTLTIRDHLNRTIQECGHGEFFVSRAFLSKARSPAAIVAPASAEVLRIPQKALLAFLDENPRQADRVETLIESTEESLRIRHEKGSSKRLPVSVVA